MKEEIIDLERLISKDELKSALTFIKTIVNDNDTFSDLENKILTLEGRLSSLYKSYNIDSTVNYEQYLIELSKIRIAIINLKDILKKNIIATDDSPSEIYKDFSIDTPTHYKDKELIFSGEINLLSKARFTNCSIQFKEAKIIFNDSSEIIFENSNVQISRSIFIGVNSFSRDITIKDSSFNVQQTIFKNLSHLQITISKNDCPINFNKCEFYKAFEVFMIECNTLDYITLNLCEFYSTPLYTNCRNLILQNSEFYNEGEKIQLFMKDDDYYTGIRKCEFYNSDVGLYLYIHSDESETTIFDSEFNSGVNSIQIFINLGKNEDLMEGQIKVKRTLFVHSSKFYCRSGSPVVFF